MKTALRLACLLLALLTLTFCISSCASVSHSAENPTETTEETKKDMGTDKIIPETYVPNEESPVPPEACEHEIISGECVYCGIKYDGSVGLCFLSNGDGTCRVAGIGSCTDRHIVIPETSPDGETVTSIGSRAFAWHYEVESVYIPESVTSIGKSAFFDCLELTSLVFEDPDGWRRDGKRADVSNPMENARTFMNDSFEWKKY